MLPDSPVIVTGLPRSGTSLVMRMLEAAGIPALTDRQRTADEDNPHGYFEIEAAKSPAAVADLAVKAAGHCVKITIPQIRQVPGAMVARVIHVKRDLAEVIASQSKMLARTGRQPAAPAAVLIPAFQRLLADAEKFLQSAAGFQVFTVDYRQLVQEPGASAAAMAAFLDKPDAGAAMAACIEPGLYRNRGEG